MRISLILAASENNVIGNDNALPWHLPRDLKYFKEKTKGHVIIMGRKTFEALGKPLPHRTHVIVSRNKDYQVPEGVYLVGSLEEAYLKAEELGESEAFVIGGGEIYRQSLDRADLVYLTRIFESFEGDTKFDELDPKTWKLKSGEVHPSDEKNPHRHAFFVYSKLKKPVEFKT